MIRNNMRIRVDVEKIKGVKESDLPPIPTELLDGKIFFVDPEPINPYRSWVNDAGNLVFLNSYVVEPQWFEIVEDLNDPVAKTYTIIIEHGIKHGTLEVLDINGVVSHEYRDAGLLVKLTEDEQFYPWSYGYGIDTVTVTKTED